MDIAVCGDNGLKFFVIFVSFVVKKLFLGLCGPGFFPAPGRIFQGFLNV